MRKFTSWANEKMADRHLSPVLGVVGSAVSDDRQAPGQFPHLHGHPPLVFACKKMNNLMK